MPDLLWSFDQLARFTRYDDPEVRYWAADRLVRLFPAEAADVLADLLVDDHDATPEMVAEHLGHHGGHRHIPLLLKGFRHGQDLTPARCLEALARIGYEAAPAVAETALHRRGVPESALGLMAGALAEMSSKGSAEAGDKAREFLLRRPELYAEPGALRGAIQLFAPADLSDVVLNWITSLHFKGLDQIGPCVRVLLEELQLEDCGWCVRTDRDGRIDFERTLKAIESGFDLDLRAAIPLEVRSRLAQRLRRGAFCEIAGTLGGFVAEGIDRARPGSTEVLAVRLRALGGGFQDPRTLEMADRLEPALHQWLIGLLMSAAVKVTTYRDYLQELAAAGNDPETLLELAGTETSCLLRPLPIRLSDIARRSTHSVRSRIVEWCVRTLEARGPFFPKAVALETLGHLEVPNLVPEIAAHLADDNAYIYGAAERALGAIGRPVIGHTRSLLRRGGVQPDAIVSLVRISSELCREESLGLMKDHFDDILEMIGPEAAAEAAGLLGHRDMIPHLRRWLDRSPAMVGHSLLLIGAINNVPVPEEESILQAIDDYWKGAAEDSAEPQGPYLM